METATEYKVDKSTWGAGPWQDEPDRVDFIAHGFACLALRHPQHGHYCGYVGVPPEHPLHGRPWDELAGLDFHGGINYANPCDGERVCHVPAPGMPDDVWWIGGDFGHVWDKQPGRDARLHAMAGEFRGRGEERTAALFERVIEGIRPAVYRALPYVRAEIEDLARQLREAEA